MIHISIEGMDGVGKTTTCRLLAEKLGYKFVEKNLRFLFDENDGYDNYFRIRDKANADSVCLLLGFTDLVTFISIPSLRTRISLPTAISSPTLLGAVRRITLRCMIFL